MIERLDRGWGWFHEGHRTSDVVRPAGTAVTDGRAQAAYEIRSRDDANPRSVVIQLRAPEPGEAYGTGLAHVTRLEGESEDSSYTSLGFESTLVLQEARWVDHVEPPPKDKTRLR